MKIKNYRPSKGFTWALFLVIFTSWIVFKCVPLTEKEQEGQIKVLMEAKNRRLAQEFDSYTSEDFSRLPKFDSRKYALLKRNGRFWLIPREYYADSGFKIRWPTDVNKLLKKEWRNDSDRDYAFNVFMYSPQYYGDTTDYWGREIYNNISCQPKPYVGNFKWNGVLIRIYDSYHRNIKDERYLDVCLTALKILNEEIKEIHYVN
ncbi:hypothetical protein IAE19_09250 [Acinetobacter sp. S40]|uniref:hypothetical protein n=1 Tax=Acinetobacter sp. S40 TaxID=2767434 RepID=UPI00190CD510|nr:hypothetical protein [Acinetobacter sp. S40]MBJ9985626.1 hypothetical protein [Acinetobacter sp. S40]